MHIAQLESKISEAGFYREKLILVGHGVSRANRTLRQVSFNAECTRDAHYNLSLNVECANILPLNASTCV